MRTILAAFALASVALPVVGQTVVVHYDPVGDVDEVAGCRRRASAPRSPAPAR